MCVRPLESKLYYDLKLESTIFYFFSTWQIMNYRFLKHKTDLWTCGLLVDG